MMPKSKKNRLVYKDTCVFSELSRKTKKWGAIARYYKAEKCVTKKMIFLIDKENHIMHIKRFTKGSTVYSQHYRRIIDDERGSAREGIFLIVEKEK